MAKKKKPADPLADLLAAARPEVLIHLVTELAEHRPDVRRKCFEYLKKHVSLTAEQQSRSEEEIVMALWGELRPDLEELDDTGAATTRRRITWQTCWRVSGRNWPARRSSHISARNCSTRCCRLLGAATPASMTPGISGGIRQGHPRVAGALRGQETRAARRLESDHQEGERISGRQRPACPSCSPTVGSPARSAAESPNMITS